MNADENLAFVLSAFVLSAFIGVYRRLTGVGGCRANSGPIARLVPGVPGGSCAEPLAAAGVWPAPTAGIGADSASAGTEILSGSAAVGPPSPGTPTRRFGPAGTGELAKGDWAADCYL